MCDRKGTERAHTTVSSDQVKPRDRSVCKPTRGMPGWLLQAWPRLLRRVGTHLLGYPQGSVMAKPSVHTGSAGEQYSCGQHGHGGRGKHLGYRHLRCRTVSAEELEINRARGHEKTGARSSGEETLLGTPVQL
jgi:hypothetical protein